MNYPRKTMNWKSLILLFAVMVLAMGVTTVVTEPQTVEAAAKNGFVTEGSSTYYYQNGKLTKGWKKINGSWYYFNSKGVMKKDYFKTTRGNTYYVGSDGKRVYGFQIIEKKKYYFEPSKGILQKTGFTTIGKNKYYLSRKTGVIARDCVFRMKKKTYWAGESGALQTGWKVVGKTSKYYFKTTGAVTGWNSINGSKYCMDSKGICYRGWKTVSGKKYYFIASGNNMGKMLRNGEHKVGGKTYYFARTGVMQYEVSTSSTVNSSALYTPTSAKTIKNFLAGALQPVGGTLYVWAGGHDTADATRKGVSATWKNWYNSNSGSYNYANYRYKYGYGLDCSGFVGWAVYQVMETKSGGNWYTCVSGETGTLYKGRGYGSTALSGKIGTDYKAGDILYNSNHVWIVIGKCSDNSVVLVHSSPPCVQICGTPTPGGSYSSKAISLAKSYMKKYYGSTVTKFGLGSQVSTSYLSAYSRFRWNNATLSDPNGYRSKNASQILNDLFN